MIDLVKCGLSEKTQILLIDCLRSFPKIQNAKVFGSRALGRYREGSDIDIALNAPQLNHSEFLKLSTTLDDLLLPYKIDLVLIHQIDNTALLDHINRAGVDLI